MKINRLRFLDSKRGHFVQLLKLQIPNVINLLEIIFQCKYKVFSYVTVQIQWFLKLASGNHKKQELNTSLLEQFGIIEEKV